MKTTPNNRSVRPLIPFAGYLSSSLSCFSPRNQRVSLAHGSGVLHAAGGGFDMKKTLDSFMDSVSQKQLTEAQSKALSDRFNDALEKSLAEYQQQHHVVILVSPAVVQGAPDVTRNIQHDIARRMKGEQ